MDPVIRRTVAENALETVIRGLEAHAPGAGPFPARRWELELPPPYGPTRRLVIRLSPMPDQAGACSLEGEMWGARQLLGVFPGNADGRGALENGDAQARLEAFLEWALEEVDQLLKAMQPLDLPLVAIDRAGVPFALLDHRDTGIERWGPGDLQCAWWRLLLRDDAGYWHNAGVANSQAAGTQSGLRVRIQEAVAAFDGLMVREFSFRLWKPSPGEIGEPVRGTHSFQLRWGPPPPTQRKGSARDLHRHRPAINQLREICGAVIIAAGNDRQAVLDAARAAADRTRAEQEKAAASARRQRWPLHALKSALRSLIGRGGR